MRIRDYTTFRVGLGTEVDEHVLIWLLLGFVFFLPISTSFSQPFAYLAVGVWAYGLFRRRDFSFMSSPWFWPVCLFAFLTLLAALMGPNPMDSIPKSRRLLLMSLIFPLGSLFRTDHHDARANTFILMGLFVAGTSLLGVWDIIRVPFSVFRGENLYDTGNMRDPQLYMMGICFILALWKEGVRRSWGNLMTCALMLNVLGVILHFKRGVWLSLFIAAFMIACVSRQRRIIMIMGLLVLFMAALPQTRDRINLLQEEFLVETGGRYVLWTQIAPRMILDYPAGTGPRGLEHEDFLEYSTHIQPGLNHLHNNFMQVAVDSGWAGLIVWIWWMALSGIIMIRLHIYHRKNAPETAALALGCFGAFTALMLNGMVEYNFGTGVIFMALIMLMGIAQSIRDSSMHDERGDLS